MRQEFSDKQKAEIFARDRAVCAFSGKSLWVLDYGVSPTFDIDWVDHIRPAARGGGNSIENGICASSFYNSKKRDNTSDCKFMFREGKPTNHFFYFYEEIPAKIAEHLARFANIEVSDWYFNRALYRFMNGVGSIRSIERGKAYKRDAQYYAKSTLKILNQWRSLPASLESISQRGLLPLDLTSDQLALLKVAQIDNQDELIGHMHACYPWYSSSCDAMNLIAKAGSPQELASVANEIDFSKLPARIASIVRVNLEKLPSAYAGRL